MQKVIAGVLAAWIAAGCGPAALRTHIKVDDVPLGKVVVYRNGVAFYERRAQVRDGKLTVSVPRDRVDDFLKSLTVVDARTQTPLPVAFPRTQSAAGPYIDMTLDVKVPAGTFADVLLTYVTESSAWKPSYRLVVGQGGKVMIEGWAVVDNLSGEDWNRVRVGVGSSAAMSFRYDLWSVRTVEREALAADEQFAIAPPIGVSPYGGSAGAVEGAGQTLVTLEDGEIRRPDGHPDVSGVAVSGSTALENQYATDGIGILAGRVEPTATTGVIRGRVTDSSGMGLPGATVVASSPSLQGEQVVITDETGSYAISALPPGTYKVTYYYDDATFQRGGVLVQVNKASPVFQKIDTSRETGEIITIEGRAPMIDQGSTSVTTSEPGWDHLNNRPVAGRTFSTALGAAAGSSGDGNGAAYTPPKAVPPPNRFESGDNKIAALVPDLVKNRRHVVVEGYAAPGEPDAAARSLDRANVVRNQLIDAGMPPARVRAVGKGNAAGRGAGVQLLTEAPPTDGGATRTGAARPVDTSDAPVGESHFLSGVPMDVRRGTSAMVSVLRETTKGEEVYLYDAESVRGDKRYAFKSVRLVNPTEFTLEAGPVTVYGKDRYIGEGLTEPVPPRAPVVVPFALDRQVVVDRDESTGDEVSRLMTVQRGVLTAEVQHLRRTKLTFTSRLHVSTRVYIRHTTQKGWELRDPDLPVERVAEAQLFELTLPAGATKSVELVETTPLTRTLDLAAPSTLDLMNVFVESPYPDDALESQLRGLLAIHRDLVDQRDKITNLREHLIEYRERSGELTQQLASLKKLKAASDLSRHLATRLKEMSDRIQATTIDIVDTQEELMLTRVKFQDALADLTLPDLASL
ncbi:MAG TPA: carboxypeptidase regulatory-like domain-containing protein [Kofleriaceae bacterium]|nr:carboxypeptidase regulatory-like domain-containing protein [Kofleriaceae bacterium]